MSQAALESALFAYTIQTPASDPWPRIPRDSHWRSSQRRQRSKNSSAELLLTALLPFLTSNGTT